MLFNLQERDYDHQKFDNQVFLHFYFSKCLCIVYFQILDFPFPDHHPPPINLLFQIVNSIHTWLKAEEKNVVVVHCKGGKGRTGTVISCYMFYSALFSTIDEAEKYFARQRSVKGKGVTGASQRRYFNILFAK